MSLYQKASAWVTEKAKRGWTFSRNLLSTYKRGVVASALILTIAGSGIGIGHTYYQSHVNTIYQVYWQGDPIGVVDDPTVLKNWISTKVKEESNKFEHVQLHVDNHLRFEAKEQYKPTFNNQSALNRLEEEFSLKANAVKLVIDGEFIGYAPDEETVRTILDSFKLNYVSQKTLQAVRDKSEEKKEQILIASVEERKQKEEDINQPETSDVRIKQDVQLEESTVLPGQVLNDEEIKKRLTKVRVEEQTYEIQSGDVLGTIAQKHNLTTKDLLNLNPDLSLDSLLQIGQELVVTGQEPYLTVETVEKVKKEEEIAYTVERKRDPNMYRGDSRVEQRGKKGKKIVEYEIIKENGKIKERKVLSERVIEEPVTRVVVVGEKIKPSRGTGKFKWPTIGGDLTSEYGIRWGKLHKGIDIAGRNRTIMAADNGTVVRAGWQGGYGYRVVIDHDNGYRTLYAHLSSITVNRGEVVRKGDQIGVMGSTGHSTGIHLHFEIRKNGRVVNPISYFR